MEGNRSDFKPVIIIGAPRSGTNLLRDVLTSIEGLDTWPCDEINYIWRHGNARYGSDEFPAELARPEVIKYIRAQFESLARDRNATIVIEKTCANSLRVPFVRKVFPEARFIYIYRNGIDAAASACLRWKAPLDIPYILQKARYVPATDLPYYCSTYFMSRIYRLFSRERRLSTWGPRLADSPELLTRYNLVEFCGIQWQRCVEAAEQAFKTVPARQLLRLNYDTFVRQPAAEMQRILEFIGHDAAPGAISEAVSSVRSTSLGKAQSTLTAVELAQLQKLIRSTLDRHG